jgi:hypothetical protein
LSQKQIKNKRTRDVPQVAEQLQVQGPEFNPQYCQKILKKGKEHCEGRKGGRHGVRGGPFKSEDEETGAVQIGTKEKPRRKLADKGEGVGDCLSGYQGTEEAKRGWHSTEVMALPQEGRRH